MLRWLRAIVAVFLLSLFLLRAVAGASIGASRKAGAQPRIHALKVTEEITMDGKLLEAAWQQAEPVTELLQQDPTEGAPASEKTEVRVLYDSHHLYIGIRAWDSSSQGVLARELTRDSNFRNDDKVEILLDTYHDRRNAYRFAVNPLGTQQDALVTDEGRDVNVSWDTAWVSEATRDPQGWTVEIRIPLVVLRFREGQDVWGFNVSRIIRRKNEETLWSSWQRALGLERVSQAGELAGMAEVRRPRLFEVRPYSSVGWRQGATEAGQARYDAGATGNVGLDVAKIGLTPSLTAEVAVNPDFGETEVDEEVVNLTRFSVFLPEKRDFFLENAGIFLFGAEETNQLFFTRRIGLTEELDDDEGGQPIPIDYGAKVTGRAGRYELGLMQVQTRALGADISPLHIPRQHYTVLRVKREILGRSYIGGIFTNRQGGVLHDYNRGGGVDTRLQLSDFWRVEGFFMNTATPGLRSSTHSAQLATRYDSDLWRAIFRYEDIGDNFNPEMGFVLRQGIRREFGHLAWKPRPRFLPWVRQFEFESSLDYIANHKNELETRELRFGLETNFENSAEIDTTFIEEITDVLAEPFEIHGNVVIPPGSYDFRRHSVRFRSDRSRRVVVSGRQEWGSFYSGTRHESEAGIEFRPNPHLQLELSDSYNRVKLKEGTFDTNLFVGRATYNFSRKVLTTALVQLNSEAELSVVNLRLRYIFRPNSDFFVIYRQSTGRGLERPSYLLQLKIAYHWSP